MFEEMTDLERKEFLYTLIERIDLFPERQENGSILKRIRFKFRVDYDAEAGGKVLLNENDVETCVLLSKLKSTPHIEVEVELDELELTRAESKATYAEIKQYVLENFGLKVSQLYIAQVKRKHGLIERINYNVGEGKARVPQVPEEKEKAIEDALRHFQMI